MLKGKRFSGGLREGPGKGDDSVPIRRPAYGESQERPNFPTLCVPSVPGGSKSCQCIQGGNRGGRRRCAGSQLADTAWRRRAFTRRRHVDSSGSREAEGARSAGVQTSVSGESHDPNPLPRCNGSPVGYRGEFIFSSRKALVTPARRSARPSCTIPASGGRIRDRLR